MTNLVQWFENLLKSWGFAPLMVTVVEAIIVIVFTSVILLVLDIFLVWVERKVVARFQDRLGPNRLGPFGLIQPFADILKLLIKEDIMPKGADKFIYNLSPIIALATVLLLWAVIPFAPKLVGADLNVGILYILSIGAISTLGIIMAGWAANNKYALLGAFRTVAQMVSYEVPMVIAMLVPVILSRSMGFHDIADNQVIWYVVVAPVAALIFLITSIAELGRTPFDLLEAESEIVAGFHIEYTGMKFGLFYAGELLHTFTVGALFSTLFLGGWRGPFAEELPVLGIFYLMIKSFLVYYVIMWIKYTLPRLRIDHMLNFNWKFLTPLALATLLVTAITEKLLVGSATWVHTLILFLVNILLAWITLAIVRHFGKRERRRVAEPRPVARPAPTPTITIEQA